MSIGTIKQAERILKAYAEDLEGLTMEECAEAGFSPPQCFVLSRVLGKGKEGEVTLPETYQLKQVGFAKEFVKTLAGADGREALRRSGRWLAKECYYSRSCGRDALKDGVPGLIEALKDGDKNVRRSAAMLLGQIGNVRSLSALIEVLKDGDENVRRSAAWALGEIRDARALPVLIKVLKDGDGDVRSSAAWALGDIGKSKGVSSVAPAISELRRMAKKDPDPLTRQTAQKVLEELMGEMR